MNSDRIIIRKMGIDASTRKSASARPKGTAVVWAQKARQKSGFRLAKPIRKAGAKLAKTLKSEAKITKQSIQKTRLTATGRVRKVSARKKENSKIIRARKAAYLKTIGEKKQAVKRAKSNQVKPNKRSIKPTQPKPANSPSRGSLLRQKFSDPDKFRGTQKFKRVNALTRNRGTKFGSGRGVAPGVVKREESENVQKALDRRARRKGKDVSVNAKRQTRDYYGDRKNALTPKGDTFDAKLTGNSKKGGDRYQPKAKKNAATPSNKAKNKQSSRMKRAASGKQASARGIRKSQSAIAKSNAKIKSNKPRQKTTTRSKSSTPKQSKSETKSRVRQEKRASEKTKAKSEISSLRVDLTDPLSRSGIKGPTFKDGKYVGRGSMAS